MKEWIYPRERTLGLITLVLGLLVWLALIIGTFGGALLGLLLGFILYLFAQSALISHVKGNGVELSESQFPDLYAQFKACCEKLGIEKKPQVYILNENGSLNAFATRFLGREYVVLMSDIVDAMDAHEDGVKFYIGHELGHLRMKHINGHLLRWPVLWLPLLGAAYSRARETTCDRHGLACCASGESASKALAALSAGSKRWKALDTQKYIDQTKYSSGFWMSFHELISGYPWLSKRVARVVNSDADLPKRNVFSYIFALFVPFAGRLGGAFGFIIMVYIIGVLAAVALPAYQGYAVKAELTEAVIATQDVRDNLARYYESNQVIPESLSEAGIDSEVIDDDIFITLDTDQMALTVESKKGSLIFTPSIDDQDKIIWSCDGGYDVTYTQLPDNCIAISE